MPSSSSAPFALLSSPMHLPSSSQAQTQQARQPSHLPHVVVASSSSSLKPSLSSSTWVSLCAFSSPIHN
ncbi:hypothetical protein E4T56_gene14700 [Termitomyces sp. T112]|nr:hypothetical protein E4T56_gene14700 [Termitomyces sp. T112]